MTTSDISFSNDGGDIVRCSVLILGSGPAGLTAAIYAARAGLRCVVLGGLQEGGQLMITTDVENYPGFSESVLGPDLMAAMRLQALRVGAEIHGSSAISCALESRPFRVRADGGREYLAESLIIATGATAKWLGVPGESALRGFGVSACATCDGAFFKDLEVAVIGGGNTAVEEALFLTRHASRVYVIHRRDKLRAEKILQEKLFSHAKVEMLWCSIVSEMLGEEELTGVMLQESVDGVERERMLAVSGVFVAIGHVPETGLFRDQVAMDSEGYIITTADSTRTNIEGVFAAGDVSDRVFRQAVTAAGLGCMAALEAQAFFGLMYCGYVFFQRLRKQQALFICLPLIFSELHTYPPTCQKQ